MFQPEVQKNKNTAVSAFLTSLVRLQHSLYKKETADWLVAREAALSLTNPRRYDLVQFYKDMETDLFIKGQVRQRINRIKNRAIKVISKTTGKVDEDKTKILKNKRWFREFIRYAMEAKFHGYSLIYFTVDARGRLVCKCVYRDHVIPEKTLIVKNPYDSEGINYTDPKFINSVIAVGDPESLGIYEELAIPYVLRKHSWASWDEFEELFGVPLRWINTPATDKKTLDALESFAITMGAANYAIMPGGAEMKIMEGRTQDAFNVFNEKRKAVNEEISIAINGHSEQINEKGSRGKSETIISKTQDEITIDDKNDIITVINEDLLPTLNLLFGFNFTEDDEVQWDDTVSLAPKEQAEIYKQVSDMGYELDPTEVSEVLSIKILGKKDKTDTTDTKKKDKKEPENTAYNHFITMHTKIAELYNHIED